MKYLLHRIEEAIKSVLLWGLTFTLLVAQEGLAEAVVPISSPDASFPEPKAIILIGVGLFVLASMGRQVRKAKFSVSQK